MRRAAFGLVVALIFPAAARADFTPPEVFVAEGDSSSTQGSPPVWQPLEGARLTGAYRYRLGVRLQANSDSLGREYVLVQAAQAPQTPQNGAAVLNPGPGGCASVRGTAGDIVQAAGATAASAAPDTRRSPGTGCGPAPAPSADRGNAGTRGCWDRRSGPRGRTGWC